ncbi:MAG: hypothetical protein HQ568_05865 [Calditrichaeota bacterium]|nr:hypothetical protein [Calditrichota bacterium]
MGGGLETEEFGGTYLGLSVGIGAQWMWGANGFDFDIYYTATSGFDNDEFNAKNGFDIDDPRTVLVSIGYRRAF